MIAQEVAEGADRLVDWWDTQSNGLPCLRLDYGWPSIGSIDLITYFLRNGGNCAKERESFLRSVACYLGCCVYDSWKVIGKEVGEEPEVLEMPDGITLRIGSVSSPGGRVHLYANITRALDRLLLGDFTELQVLPNFKRIAIYPNTNLLSMFGIGLALGFAPQCSGPLSNRSVIQAKSQNEQILRKLASSSADYYKTVFGDEKVGQVAELYLNDLIYPPIGMNEPFHAKRAVEGILNFADYCSLTDEHLTKLALNLTLSPDETISSAGLAVYAALLKGKPDPRAVAIGSGRHPFSIALRSAMVHARELRLKEPDWLFVERDLTEPDIERYKLEAQMNFLPRLNLPTDYIYEPSIRKVIRYFAQFDFPGGVKAFNHLAGQNKDDLTMRLQRGALALLSQNKEKAQEEYDFFSKNNQSDVDPIAQACFLADFHASNGKYEDALSCLRKVDSVARTRGPAEVLEYYNMVGTLLVCLSRFAEALSLFQKIDPMGEKIASALGQVVASRKVGKNIAPDEALLKLKALWPTNRSALAALYMVI